MLGILNFYKSKSLSGLRPVYKESSLLWGPHEQTLEWVGVESPHGVKWTHENAQVKATSAPRHTAQAATPEKCQKIDFTIKLKIFSSKVFLLELLHHFPSAASVQVVGLCSCFLFFTGLKDAGFDSMSVWAKHAHTLAVCALFMNCLHNLTHGDKGRNSHTDHLKRCGHFLDLFKH